MKWIFLAKTGLFLAALPLAHAGDSYTNFIRQVQLPSGVQWDASVAATGEGNSTLSVDQGGARFELWTVLSSTQKSYLLDTRFVSAYAPSADVKLVSEDPYTLIPRTRADRPFTVELTVSGLLGSTATLDAAKSIKFLRHVQSYGTKGTGSTLDRSLATLVSQTSVTANGTQKLTFLQTSIPSANLAKVRGEERFSAFSLADGLVPESQIASRYIQIWPVADGGISGITADQKVGLQIPKLTLTLNDLYPDSRTYAQAYPGEAKLGTSGAMLSGSLLILNEPVPQDRVLLLDGSDYSSVFTKDGRWTIELITVTPFGTERLAYVSFNLDRTITVNGTVSTIE